MFKLPFHLQFLPSQWPSSSFTLPLTLRLDLETHEWFIKIQVSIHRSRVFLQEMNVKRVYSPECGFYLFNIKLSFREKTFCASFPCVPSLAGDCVVGNCSFGLRPTFPHVQESHYSASHVNTDGIKMMVWDRFRLWTGNQGIGFLNLSWLLVKWSQGCNLSVLENLVLERYCIYKVLIRKYFKIHRV